MSPLHRCTSSSFHLALAFELTSDKVKLARLGARVASVTLAALLTTIMTENPKNSRATANLYEPIRWEKFEENRAALGSMNKTTVVSRLPFEPSSRVSYIGFSSPINTNMKVRSFVLL